MEATFGIGIAIGLLIRLVGQFLSQFMLIHSYVYQ
jgi:hypothetical protein